MGAVVIRGGTVYTPTEVQQGAAVVIRDGRINAVGSPAEVWPGDAGPGDSVIDAEGLLVVPGFLDLQVNGFAGRDFQAGDREAVAAVSQALLPFGVTGFLPTVVTDRPEQMLRAVRAIGAGMAARESLALGIHVEGPFISQLRRGAHPVEQIRPFDQAEWEVWWEACGGAVRMVTMAPEQPGNLAGLARVRQRGAIVAIGHSDATYEQAMAAAEAGAVCATHLFNGMRGLHHREPGLAGAVLSNRALLAGIIADGQHLHPAVLQLLLRAKGPDELYLVTDAVPAACLPAGRYEWVGGAVVSDGEVVRTERDGSLAGSLLTMDRAVRNMVRLAGADLSGALTMATLTPARLLGLDDRGRVSPGMRADLVLLDEHLNVVMTLVAGDIRFQRQGRELQ